MSSITSRLCIYCGQEKPSSEFSDEHIWPDALGGDHLPDFWRTKDVCQNCNSMSGVFVDGSFIRGWAGSMERGSGALEYMCPDDPRKNILPLNYLGKFTDVLTAPGDVADWWVGPCGATIVHIRPQESEDLWKSYSEGDPRAKKFRAGRAYIALASANEYWIVAALASFAKHFKRARRYVVNMEIPREWSVFENVDRSDEVQAKDMEAVNSIIGAAKAGKSMRAQVSIQVDAGHRFLCKVALAAGCKLFGPEFTNHPHGYNLRRAFREPSPERRQEFPVRGSGYFNDVMNPALAVMAWTAGWVLMVQLLDKVLVLSVVTPTGKVMAIQVTDDVNLIADISSDYTDGIMWLTVPTLSKAVGPMPLPNYIAHKLNTLQNSELTEIENARIDPALLPPC